MLKILTKMGTPRRLPWRLKSQSDLHRHAETPLPSAASIIHATRRRTVGRERLLNHTVSPKAGDFIPMPRKTPQRGLAGPHSTR